MPSGQNYQPVLAGKWTENQFLASIQNLFCLLATSSTGSSSVQAGSVSLVSGQTDGYTGTFSTAFASTPKIVLTGVKNGTASANIVVTAYTVTTTGFSFDLQGNPGTGASVNFLASL